MGDFNNGEDYPLIKFMYIHPKYIYKREEQMKQSKEERWCGGGGRYILGVYHVYAYILGIYQLNAYSLGVCQLNA